jgi:hypothetical protein
LERLMAKAEAKAPRASSLAYYGGVGAGPGAAAGAGAGYGLARLLGLTGSGEVESEG